MPPTKPTSPETGTPARPYASARRGTRASELLRLDESLRNSQSQIQPTQSKPGRGQPSAWITLGIPLLAASVVGAALGALGPWDRPFDVVLRVGADPTQQLFVRRELAEYVSRTSPAGGRPRRWTLDAAANTETRLRVFFPRHEDGVAGLLAISHGFIEELKNTSLHAQQTPSEPELVLAHQVTDSQERLERAKQRAEQTLAAVPNVGKRADLGELLQRWRLQRAELQNARDRLAAARTEWNQLHAQGAPQSGIVSTDERRAAIDADPGLREDLRELSVNLTELRRELQKAGKESDGALVAASQALEQLNKMGAEANGESLDDGLADQLKTIEHETSAFMTALGTFTQAWTTDFQQIESLSIDPQSGRLLDEHLRLTKSLTAFLYDGGRRLTTLRTLIAKLDQSPADDARHHVLFSDVTRSFQALQSAFSHFEAVAETIEGHGNVRLDAALRASRGLRRRSQEQIRIIEGELQKQAARRAKQQHDAALAQAEEQIAQLGSASERSLDLFLTIQDELNDGNAGNEEFSRAMFHIELATTQIRIAQEDLDRLQTELHAAQQKRSATDFAAGVQLISCGPAHLPHELLDRVWTGSLAAMCTFITVFACQMWTLRSMRGRASA